MIGELPDWPATFPDSRKLQEYHTYLHRRIEEGRFAGGEQR